MRHTVVQNKLTVFTSILVLAFLLMAAPAHAAGWTVQSSGTSARLRDVYFVNSSTGWAVGDGGTILKTIDSGASWVPQSSNTTLDLYGVDFIDANTGWVVGRSGVLRKTINGGRDWTVERSETSENLYAVDFIDENTGWSVGGSISTSVIRRSNFGGVSSWFSQTSPLGGALYDVKFRTNTRGVVVGINNAAEALNGKISVTTNGGSTWTMLNLGTDRIYRGAELISRGEALQGWVVGDGGSIQSASDFQIESSWRSQSSGATNQLNSVDFIDISRGWVVGNSGTILSTSNSGSTWIRETVGSANLNAVSFVDADHGWTVGDSGTIRYFDGTPPETTITFSPSSSTTDTSATFTFTATETSIFGCSLDGAVVYSLCTSPRTYTGLSVGAHTFQVRATDGAGNIDDTPASFSWTITAPPPGDTTAPETSITTSPTASTTSTSATFAFTATETATFGCRLDSPGGAFFSCTSPRTYSGLAVGSHAFEVRATDTAGNIDLSSATFSWTITAPAPAGDTIPPSVSGITPVTATTGVAEAFAASYSDNVQITLCELGVNDVVQGSMAITGMTSGTALRSHTFASAGSYTVQARCSDGTNLTVGPSTIVTVSDAADTSAPTVPSGLSRTTADSDSTPAFIWSAATDNVGVVGYEVQIDGVLSYTNVGNVLIYTAQALADGTYTVRVRARDAAGNLSGAASLSFTIAAGTPAPTGDTTAPSAPTNLVRTSSADDTTPAFTWSASTDNVAVTAYHVQIDAGAFMGIDLTTTYTVTALALSVGTHTFGVRAGDGAGNISGVTQLTFVIGSAAEPTPTPTPTPAPTPTPTPSTDGPPFSLTQMEADAQIIVRADLTALLSSLTLSSVSACQMSITEATARVSRVFSAIGLSPVRTAIINFTACGTVSTLHLGAGERLGVVNSYKAAFGRLPSTSAHWFDIIKIGNGRFPGESSKQAESDAEARFRKIYLRGPKMNQQNDKSAVTVMAYGLRPLPRNLNSERAAIKIFKGIFGYNPSSATDWDAVRAVAYSGAIR